MTDGDERRLARLRHDGRLLGWSITGLGDRISCRHERGAATISWPWPRNDVHERVLLTVLRQPVPMSPEDEACEREKVRRKAEAAAFYDQLKAAGR